MLNAHTLKKAAIAAVAMGFMVGCAGADDEPNTPADQQLDLVMPGKADDYYSNVSKEFEVTGQIAVEMTTEEYEDEATRNRLIDQRISALGVYLTTYLTDKFEGIDINGDGQIGDDEIFFYNTNYGGFKAMVRNKSTETLEIEDAEAGILVTFTIDVAGPNNLYDMLRADGAMEGDIGLQFDLRMPAGETSDSSRPIRSFDPDTYQGELETITLSVMELPEVADAYPEYNAFFADGTYDITMVFGHDYNAARYDLQDAQQAFNALVADGFEAPVASFDELAHNSGPFTKQMISFRPALETCQLDYALASLNSSELTDDDLKAMGFRSDARRNFWTHRAGDDGVDGTADDVIFATEKDVDSVYRVGPRTIEKMLAYYNEDCSTSAFTVNIEVRLLHSDMYIGQRNLQIEQTKSELVSRDVIFYNGHAGPYYGFYMDEAYEAYIDDTEFATLDFDPNKKQLFIAQGCQTYSQYADMMYANPNKNEDNLDVITTVNYSYARGTVDLFRNLVQTDAYEPDVHMPATYNDIITTLNAEQVNDAYQVFYGVIGIDQNEKLSPYAKVETIGDECAAHSDCGDTFNGNLCAGFTDGINRCVARTAAESGCPDGTNYAYVASEQYVVGGVCWVME